jgi:hypothetical protein
MAQPVPGLWEATPLARAQAAGEIGQRPACDFPKPIPHLAG